MATAGHAGSGLRSVTFSGVPHVQEIQTRAVKRNSVYTEVAMPSRASILKRPLDSNVIVRSAVGDLIGETMEGDPLSARQPEREKNQAAVELSRLGASKGGIARALALSANQRSRIAKKAAKARWGK